MSAQRGEDGRWSVVVPASGSELTDRVAARTAMIRAAVAADTDRPRGEPEAETWWRVEHMLRRDGDVERGPAVPGGRVMYVQPLPLPVGVPG